MIGMIVRQNERIEPAYPFAREGRSQGLRIGTGIDEHRMRAIPHEHGITLTHV